MNSQKSKMKFSKKSEKNSQKNEILKKMKF